jgi:galactose mutarotase-like enzyme
VTADLVTITGTGLAATINPLGAELWTLRDDAGRDLLWNGDPAVWAARAPVLFPIVGTLNGGHYRVDGKTYALPRHGFGRRSRFAVIEAVTDRAVFRLTANEETRAVYPFEFNLDLTFAIAGRRLDMTAELVNTGEGPLPASFGFHPAFLWPLPYGKPRAEHRIVFAAEEGAPIRRLDADGLLDARSRPTPVQGRTLVLDDSLFTEDALIFTELAGRSLSYGAPDGPQLHVHYPDTPDLGIWLKPGAPFVCIEPWQGTSDPAGFAGEIWDKPGIVRVGPNERRIWRMGVELTAA